MGIRLTKKSIEALDTPPKGYAIHWDNELNGFGVRITASGARSFVLQDRIRGRERRLTIGRYPGVTPEVARREVQKLLGQIASGGDPVAERARRKLEGVTLAQCFDEYVRLRRRRKDGKPLKERTRHDMNRVLETAFADWKRRPITAINRDMVRKRYDELTGKSVARANIAMRYLRTALNFAIASYRDAEGRPILIDNPVRVLSESSLWHGIGSRERVLDGDDLAAWLPAVLGLGEVPKRKPGEGKHKPRLRNGGVFRDFFLFLVLTGCRKSEALELRPENVDFHRGAVTFPDTKNRTDHVLPLTPYLRELLKRRIEAKGDLVFAGQDGRPIANLRYALERIAEDASIKFSPHDLRRTAATVLERCAVPGYTIKALLNHMPGSADITGSYVKVDLPMKLAALEKLQDFIFQNGKKVVALRRQA